MNDGDDVPRRLVALRARHRFSQEALGEMLGVDQATVSRWERGVQQPSRMIQTKLRELILATGEAGRQVRALDFIRHSPFLMAAFDSQFVIFATSHAFNERYRRGPSHFEGRSFKKDATVDFEEAMRAAQRKRLLGGALPAARIIARIREPDGKYGHIDAIWTPLLLPSGHRIILSQFNYIDAESFRHRRKIFGLFSIPALANRRDVTD